MLSRLPLSLPCTLALLAVAALLPLHAAGQAAAIPTATTLTCASGDPVSLGDAIPLLITVTAASGAPAGSVGVTQNGNSLGAATLSNGTASLTATAYAGTDTFIATYPANNGFAASSATCSVQVSPLGLHSNSNPALAYSTITFTARYAIQPFPGGSFTFAIDDGPAMPATGGGRNPSFANYTTDTLTEGTHTITATFSPSDGTGPYTATLIEYVTAATGDFTLTSYPPTLTVRDGLTVSGLIAATSVDDFHGPVSLACALPQALHYTCTLTPTSVQLLLNDYETTTLTLSPETPFAASRSRSHTSLAALLPLSILSLSLLGFAGSRRRTLLRQLLCLFVLVLVAASTTACGPNIFSAATPAGAYPITITATGITPGESAITHMLTLTMNLTY